jgi:hypothetical protein
MQVQAGSRIRAHGSLIRAWGMEHRESTANLEVIRFDHRLLTADL